MVPVLDRYRPAALAAAAILLAIGVLPGATGGANSAAPASFDAGAVDDVSEVGSSTGGVAAAPESGPTGETGGVPMPPVRTPSTVATGGTSSFVPPPRAAPAPSPSPSPSAPPPFDPGSFGADPDDEPEALRIVVTAYAATTGGTPVPTDVPDATLPVGTRIGQTDKASYLRLEGDETTLVLTEVADGRRGSDFEVAPVQACQILDAGWEGGENLSFSDAPEHDPEDCVDATVAVDGTWSIPLLGFSDPTDDRGLALVPSADAPIDFQVTFASVVAG